MRKGKLQSYTDTKAEAQKKQRIFLKKGKFTLIKKEYGGYAVREIPKSTLKKAGTLIKKRTIRRVKPQTLSQSLYGY